MKSVKLNQTHLFSLFFQEGFGWQNNENYKICLICISFAIAQSWCIRLSSKPVCKIAKTCFGLLLLIFQQRNVVISLKRNLFLTRQLFHYESQHVSVMTTAASCKTPLDAIKISHCQGDDGFVAFQPVAIFCSWRNGEFTFFQRYLQPFYLSQSPTPTQSSLLFCAGFQFSHNLVCVFNHQIKLWNIEGCELGGRGYLIYPWVRRCSPLIPWPLFKTKIADFPPCLRQNSDFWYPVYDTWSETISSV